MAVASVLRQTDIIRTDVRYGIFVAFTTFQGPIGREGGNLL